VRCEIGGWAASKRFRGLTRHTVVGRLRQDRRSGGTLAICMAWPGHTLALSVTPAKKRAGFRPGV
jgi:hypothetical protein